MRIKDITVRVCFNGRGDLGIEADVKVDGHTGRALSPSGASRGTNEAVPFAQESATKTVAYFQEYKQRLMGLDAGDLRGLSSALRAIDGTLNFSRIGGSLAYAVSVGAAEAEAKARGVPLCRVIDADAAYLPLPLGNIVGGGKHASDLSPSIQEVLVTPVGAGSIVEAIELNLAVHKKVGQQLSRTLSYPLGRGDEGGWSPGIPDEEALRLVSDAATLVQDESKRKIRVGVDIAADSLYDRKKQMYYYRSTKRSLTRDQQIAYVGDLKDRFDLLYIEDPLYEDDFEGFSLLRSNLKQTFIVGDDLYTTDKDRLETGIERRSTNGVIMKVNQIGTLGEAQSFASRARDDGQLVAASHRSGDNEGGHLAHFAVGFGCGLIKCGVVGGERTSKLNELIRLSELVGEQLNNSWVPT